MSQMCARAMGLVWFEYQQTQYFIDIPTQRTADILLGVK